MPETWDGIAFDEQGVCNICRESEKKVQIDWDERQKWLNEILRKYQNYAKRKGIKYDCIVGYSGGKDSAYTLLAIAKKYAMKPLVVTSDHGFSLSPEAEWNLMEIPKILDCDHLRFTPGSALRNALCRRGSEVNGDFCWHCHNGLGTLTARVASQWNIPLVIWGEPSAEYKTFGEIYSYDDLEEPNKEHFEKGVSAQGAPPEIMVPPGYEVRDLMPMLWPEGEFELKAVYLGNYEPWNQREKVEIITQELGWKHCATEGTYVDWDKVDCPYEPVRDWQKFIKRGFGRTTFQASKDIREGLITREKALRLVEELDGRRPRVLDPFLAEVEMTEEEFNQITRRHVVAAITAVAMGARIIEKHFTLDKEGYGPDHWFSMDKPELNQLVTSIRAVEKMLGDGRKKLLEIEKNSYIWGTRCIVLNKNKVAGDMLEEKDLDYKRPCLGLRPEFSRLVLERPLKRSLKKNKAVNLSDLDLQ